MTFIKANHWTLLVIWLGIQEQGTIPDEIKQLLNQLGQELLDTLSEALFDLENLEDLHNWLENINNQR